MRSEAEDNGILLPPLLVVAWIMGAVVERLVRHVSTCSDISKERDSLKPSHNGYDTNDGIGGVRGVRMQQSLSKENTRISLPHCNAYVFVPSMLLLLQYGNLIC
jgi:hypothetical protein